MAQYLDLFPFQEADDLAGNSEITVAAPGKSSIAA